MTDDRDTPYDIAERERSSRGLALRKEMKDIPLGLFRVGDLPVLMKMYGHDTLFDSELKQLDDRLAEIKAQATQP